MRYLVFVCEIYYPSGGWNDFKESFVTFQLAKEYALELYRYSDNHVHVVDLKQNEIVWER